MNYINKQISTGLYRRLLGGIGLAIMLIMFAPTASMGQTAEDALLFSERLPATGARSIGLSGTGIAGTGDFSAFFTNPAGLGYLERSQFTASLNFLSATNESFVQRTGFGNAIEDDLTDQRLGNLALAYKLPTRQGAFILGGAFNQTNTFERSLRFNGLNSDASITDVLLPFDDEFEVVEEDGSFFPRFFADIPEIAYLGGAIEFLGENVGTGDGLFYQAVNPGSTIEQASDVFQEGRMSDVSFGGAIEAARGVMVGLSLNINVGTYRFESLFDEIDINNENTEDLYIVLNGDSELRGFDVVSYEERFESDLVGTNLRVGVSAEAAENLRVGLTIETPTFYRVDEKFETVVATQFDSGGSLAYGGQSGDVGRGSFEYDVTTPFRFGAGISYDVSGLRLMGDIELVDWTQLELDASTDADFFADLNRTIRNEFKAVINTRLGAEYSLDDLRLRAGFAMQPDPIDARITTGNGATLDRSKTFFSAGVGYQFSNALSVDFGWMQERMDDVYLPDFVDYVVDENLVRNHFVVGLSVLF